MVLLTDMMQCQNLSVPMDVMRHVVQVESSANPYAIGVVGGRLVRQPQTLAEAVSTAEMLESRGYNFSVGLSQVNRYNLRKYGINSYAQAFDGCTNLQVGSKILSECQVRAKGDWGSAFSCYYSGNFTTGFEHGYVQKIYSSMAAQQAVARQRSDAIPLAPQTTRAAAGTVDAEQERRERRGRGVAVADALVASAGSILAARGRQDVPARQPDPGIQPVMLNATPSAGPSANHAGFNPEVAAAPAAESDGGSEDKAFVF